jgi:hypothetical protein
MKVVQLGVCSMAMACLLLAPAGTARGQASGGKGDFQVPTLGDLVVLPDAKTLVVTIPSAAELLFYDTVDKKQLKKVEVDFQPSAMAVQGSNLFIAKKGTATIHIVDPATAKSTKEIKVPSSDPILKLACNPSKGLLYATTDALDVFSIDPASGKVTKTKATGQEIVVDPSGEDFVYTSVYNTTKDRLLVQELGKNSFSIRLVKGQTTNLLLKYKVDGAGLKLVAANKNGGSGGPWFSVSGDGKFIAMSGPYRGPNVKGIVFNITVFQTSDMTTAAGTLDHSAFPRAIAFHPHLGLVATIDSGNPKKATVFNTKSGAKKDSFDVPNLSSFPFQLVFGGEGTKLISAVGMLKSGRQDAAVAITVHDLTLTDEQKDQLKKALKK